MVMLFQRSQRVIFLPTEGYTLLNWKPPSLSSSCLFDGFSSLIAPFLVALGRHSEATLGRTRPAALLLSLVGLNSPSFTLNPLTAATLEFPLFSALVLETRTVCLVQQCSPPIYGCSNTTVLKKLNQPPVQVRVPSGQHQVQMTMTLAGRWGSRPYSS